MEWMRGLLTHEIPVLDGSYLGHFLCTHIEHVVASDFVEDPFGSVDHGFHAMQYYF